MLITGVGLVTGLGAGAPGVFAKMLAGERAIGPVTLFDTAGQRCKVGAEVPGLDVAAVAPRGQAGRWSRTDALGLVAAREALGQAGLDPTRWPTALVLGGSTAGMFECEQPLAALHRDPSGLGPDPGFERHPLAATAGRLGEALGPFVRSRTVCSACSAGSNALLVAALWLRLGRAERVLVGASEGLCRLTFAGFDALAITDPAGCRPFDLQRRGMNLGEGAAFLVLETEAAARARGALPLAELAGWAAGTEAAHITQPEEGGATVARLIATALARAGASPDEVDFVSAHGTGTPRNDPAETAALAAAGVTRARVSSHKGQLGHTLASAGAIGAVVAVCALREGKIPPTGGLTEPDPACPARHVIGAVDADVRLALVNAFGFGGLDTVLALRRPGVEPSLAPARPAVDRVVVSAAVTLDPRGVQGPGELAALAEQLAAGAAPAPSGGPASWGPEALDPDRTRRVDRCARVATVIFQEALRAAGLAAGAGVGAVAGSAFGAVAACAEHCARAEASGGRCTNPIQFPNLVPSSPAANAAIYLGLRGPVLAAADLGLSGEIAVQTAIELLQAGEASALCAGSHAEQSVFTERIFDPLLLDLSDLAPRAEGAAALLLERESSALARGAAPLARVLLHEHGQGDPPALPPPAGRALVVTPRPLAHLAGWLASVGWGEAPVLVASAAHGDHEAAGAQAMALAAAALGAGQADQALVLGAGPGRWSALLLGRR